MEHADIESACNREMRVYVISLWKRVANCGTRLWLKSQCGVDCTLGFLDFQSDCILYLVLTGVETRGEHRSRPHGDGAPNAGTIMLPIAGGQSQTLCDVRHSAERPYLEHSSVRSDNSVVRCCAVSDRRNA